jgi:hypothetical protein
MARRLYRRSVAMGQITVPAVPSLIDEYVKMCNNLFASVGVQYSPEEFAQLKAVLESQLAEAYRTSSRSNIVISFHAPFGTALNYRVNVESVTIAGAYDGWVATREGSLFGIEPDARVSVLAGETADPGSFRVLDIGAGTGRNVLALARRGHLVDAVEIAPKLAHIRCPLRLSADCGLRGGARLPDDAAAARHVRTRRALPGSGGRLLFNAFVPRQGQQCNTMIFTWEEMTSAADELPLELVADDSAYEYEKLHLPEGAWPPTAWFANWASGLDLFDVAREESPIDLRWLVYQKA